MDRKSFLFSLPLIGLVAKALAKPKEPKHRYYVGIDPYNEDVSDGQVLVWDNDKCRWTNPHVVKETKNRVVRIKKCEDGKFLIYDPETREVTKCNLIWTDEAKIKLV